MILALVVSTLSQYSTSCRIRSTWSHYANGLNCNKGIEMFCHKCGKEFVRNELFCRRCIMNLKTPRRRLREFGLRRRNEVHSDHEVWEKIKREIEGPWSLLFLKTEQLYYNEILFQSNVQWQMPYPTNCVTHFSVRVSFKFHIDGRIAHCSQILPHICGRTSQ